MTQEKFLRTKTVAAMLGVSERTVERWREAGKGPPFVRIGGSILYPETACVEYLRKTLTDAA